MPKFNPTQHREFIVLFQKDLPFEKRQEIVETIKQFPTVKDIDISDERLRRLKVTVTDGRSRFKTMREVKELPGVFEVELITYYKTCRGS